MPIHFMHMNQRDLENPLMTRTGCESEVTNYEVTLEEEDVTCKECKKYIKERASFSFFR